LTKRNPVAVLLLAIVTLGIYAIVWLARTRGEMVARGAAIPTTWLLIVPLVNLVYYWKWSKGVEHVSGGEASGALTFVLMLLVGPVGYVYAQVQFNKVGGAAPAPSAALSH
jgi:hypothetical protein